MSQLRRTVAGPGGDSGTGIGVTTPVTPESRPEAERVPYESPSYM